MKLMLTASQHVYLVSELALGLWERLPSRTTADEHGELLVVWASYPVESDIIKLSYSPLWLGVFTLSTQCVLCNWLYNFQGDTGAKKNNYETLKQADDHVLTSYRFFLYRVCTYYVYIHIYSCTMCMYLSSLVPRPFGGGGKGLGTTACACAKITRKRGNRIYTTVIYPQHLSVYCP